MQIKGNTKQSYKLTTNRKQNKFKDTHTKILKNQRGKKILERSFIKISIMHRQLYGRKILIFSCTKECTEIQNRNRILLLTLVYIQQLQPQPKLVLSSTDFSFFFPLSSLSIWQLERWAFIKIMASMCEKSDLIKDNLQLLPENGKISCYLLPTALHVHEKN